MNMYLKNDEKILFEKNINKMCHMEYGDLFDLLKYIFCEYPMTLYAIDNMNLGYNEKKLYGDIYEVFKNEDYIDILEYNVDWKCASIVLYDVGWCGVDVFYKKVDKYIKKFKELGYKIEQYKYYDESEFGDSINNYSDIIFKFQGGYYDGI